MLEGVAVSVSVGDGIAVAVEASVEVCVGAKVGVAVAVGTGEWVRVGTTVDCGVCVEGSPATGSAVGEDAHAPNNRRLKPMEIPASSTDLIMSCSNQDSQSLNFAQERPGESSSEDILRMLGHGTWDLPQPRQLHRQPLLVQL